jgi:hypothetical protein
MFGRQAITTDPAAERELYDAFEIEEDGVSRWSYSLLGADPGFSASPLPIDGYHQTGWLTFA